MAIQKKLILDNIIDIDRSGYAPKRLFLSIGPVRKWIELLALARYPKNCDHRSLRDPQIRDIIVPPMEVIWK